MHQGKHVNFKEDKDISVVTVDNARASPPPALDSNKQNETMKKLGGIADNANHDPNDSRFELYFSKSRGNRDDDYYLSYCQHFKLNWMSAFSLIWGIFKLTFKFVWDILVLIFEGIYIVLQFVFQIVLSVLLIVYFMIFSFFNCRGKLFRPKGKENLETIRWKNLHNFFLFIKLEIKNDIESADSKLENGVSKKLKTKDILNRLPHKNIKSLTDHV